MSVQCRSELDNNDHVVQSVYVFFFPSNVDGLACANPCGDGQVLFVGGIVIFYR